MHSRTRKPHFAVPVIWILGNACHTSIVVHTSPRKFALQKTDDAIYGRLSRQGFFVSRRSSSSVRLRVKRHLNKHRNEGPP